MIDSDGIIVKVKRVRMTGQIPTRGSAEAAGWDVYYAGERERIVFGHSVESLELGIAIEIPPGWECQLRPRSGMSIRGEIGLFGTIDSDYRGELRAMIANLGNHAFTVRPGQRIGQLVFKRLPGVEMLEVDELGDSERGTSGFGSTGE